MRADRSCKAPVKARSHRFSAPTSSAATGNAVRVSRTRSGQDQEHHAERTRGFAFPGKGSSWSATSGDGWDVFGLTGALIPLVVS